MMKFREFDIDEGELFSLTEKSFFECVKGMWKDDKESYAKSFGTLKIDELKVEQASISIRKNFVIEDLHYFDQSTDLHIYSQAFVYTFDRDGDKDFLYAYTIIMNEMMEVVDEFLHP